MGGMVGQVGGGGEGEGGGGEIWRLGEGAVQNRPLNSPAQLVRNQSWRPLLTAELEEDLVGGHPVEPWRATPHLTPVGALQHGRLGDPISSLTHSLQDT